MSTPADWKRIEELAEKATERPWYAKPCNTPDCWCEWIGTLPSGDETTGVCHTGAIAKNDARFIAATANAAPDMAARLRRLNELLGPQLSRNAVFANSTWRTDDAAKVDLHLSVSAVRELLALLTGEEGEGK